MEFKLVEKTLSDGSKVWDIKLYDDRGRYIVLSAPTEADANQFIWDLDAAVYRCTGDPLVERG